MEEGFIENRATSVPFAGILADLLTANLTQRSEKRAVYDNMRGTVAIELVDIETAVTLVFAAGKLRIGGDRRASGNRHPDGLRSGDGLERPPDRRGAPLVF